MKYAAIIVVYNKNVRDSITCRCIRQIANYDVEIVIVDNSEIDQDNIGICREQGYIYIAMEGNKGLSRAYNVAIDQVKADIMILFDDDTNVSNEYFAVLDKAVADHPDVDIFAPIVYGQNNVIYSPNEFHFLKNHLIKNKNDIVAQERFNAIASCLAIRERVFDGYRFDEKLFLDQVDQYFFCEQRKLGRKFLKIDTVIHQNFYQRGAGLTARDGWKRIRLRMIDIMRHAQLMEKAQYKFLGLVKCGGLSVQISIKTRSLIVLIKGICLSIRLFVSPI